MAVAIVATPAPAESGRTQSAAQQAIDPRTAQRILAARNLVNLPDGSFIATVNGRQSNIVVRPGEQVRIAGKGFDQRRPASLVGLFLPGATTGAELAIVAWSDREIIVRVPVGNENLTTASNHARVKVQPIRANGLTLDMTVPNIRLRMGPR